MKILITGATNGIGKGVAKVLASQSDPNNEIIILCRSEKLGKETIKEIEGKTSTNKHSIVQCDLSKLSDVKKAIAEIHKNHEFLDAIFINAGLGYAAKRVETKDGFDSHFQVNYLSQFMLSLNLLSLLDKSEIGGQIIFNATKTKKEKIVWDDLQMKDKWTFESGIFQAMIAKRMFLNKLHRLHREKHNSKLSFVGFQVSKTVWSNQINMIPSFMRFIATTTKFFGSFISIEECGKIMLPLFTANQNDKLNRSGKLITWKKNQFTEITEDPTVLNLEMQDKLWNISLDLCDDEQTRQIAEKLEN